MKSKRVEHNDSERVERSAYPYMSLKPAMKITDALKELGGAKSETQKSVLAHHLGEKEKSQTLVQRITSARCYGLVEGRGAYTLTDLARQYYFPTTETEKRQAFLGMVSAPPCFGQLIKKFDGDKIPEREILANLLHREFGVPDSWKERVAGFFVSSLETAGVLDTQGILRFGATHNGALKKPGLNLIDEPPVSAVPPSELSPPAPSLAPPPAGVNVWNFSHKGKNVRLETPAELNKPLWDKLHGYVELLKPMEGESE